MSSLLASPLFGITISLLAFEIGMFLYKKLKNPIFNPLLISICIIIGFLMVSKVNFSDYNLGAQYISFFLGPATVVLAVPLYKKRELLKMHFIPILVGITVGCLAVIISIIVLSHLFGLQGDIIKSLAPKSVTMPIGLEITKTLKGLPPITVIAIIFTGIVGSIVGPYVCKFLRIRDEVSVGISLGTASHAIGTTKAMELGETQGAMSSLSIGIAGLVTVFLAPAMVHVFSKIISM